MRLDLLPSKPLTRLHLLDVGALCSTRFLLCCLAFPQSAFVAPKAVKYATFLREPLDRALSE